MDNTAIKNAMTIRLDNVLPEYPKFVEGIRRAPDRGFRLTKAQAETALRNALRYVPEELHEALAPEFMEELVTRGRIYAYLSSIARLHPLAHHSGRGGTYI